DLWGVLHDGAELFPAALECLEALKAEKKPVVILSNAPRRADIVAAYSAKLGLKRDLYLTLYSSGELTWELLRTRPDGAYRLLGNRVYCVMAERDRELL